MNLMLKNFRMMKNKKAERTASEMLETTVMIIALTFVVFILVYMVWNDGREKYEIPDNFQENILISRLINTADCFAYVDELFRIHPGTIDISKMENERFEKCVNLDATGFAIRLKLYSVDSNFDKVEIYTDNYKPAVAPEQFSPIKVLVKMEDGSEKLGRLVAEIQDGSVAGKTYDETMNDEDES